MDLGYIFMAGGVVLLILVAIPYLLLLRTNAQTQSDIDTLKERVNAGFSGEEKQLQERALTNEGRARIVRQLLKEHRRPTALLANLEQNIHPDVQLSTLSFTAEKESISMQGGAPTITAVSQQQQQFAESAAISKVSVGGISSQRAGNVQFDMRLIATEEIYTNTGTTTPQ